MVLFLVWKVFEVNAADDTIEESKKCSVASWVGSNAAPHERFDCVTHSHLEAG